MPPTLIVLAAGLGSRFGGAKQVEPFGPGGETLLELNTYDALTAGVERIVVVTRHALAEAVERVLDRLPGHLDREMRFQDDEPLAATAPPRTHPWGTAHAVLAAGAPETAALVVNADDLYGRDAMSAVVEAMGTWASNPPLAVLAGYRLDRTLSPHGGVSRGVCRVHPDGTLARIDEVRDLRRGDEGVAGIAGSDGSGRMSTYSGDTVVSLNLWGLDASCWPRLARGFERFRGDVSAGPGGDPARVQDGEFRLPDAIQEEVVAGAVVRVARTDARWVGVTHAADRQPASRAIGKLFEEGHYPSPLFSEIGS